MTLSRTSQLIGIILWWLIFVACSISGWGGPWFLTLIGAPLVLLIPGLLSLIVFEVPTIARATRVVLALGLSIVELFILGLITNTVLPRVGIPRPLDTEWVVWIVSTLILTLLALSFRNLTPITLSIRTARAIVKKSDIIFLVAPLALLGMSIQGAHIQNNGGANTLTVVMLVGVAVYSFFLYRYAARVHEYTVIAGIFLLALTLLLMTSLRGWFISGHDIQREYFAFQLTKDAGMWSMAAFQDAYNACLSITILPTMLVNMFHVADAYVFKVLFQLIFATVPVVVYLLARRMLSIPLAFLASLVFMGFPTFFQDMPFLIRQEVAFLMVGLMFVVLFEDSLHRSLRNSLFLLFGIGVVLSHYSTTYTILFIFLVTALATPLVYRAVRFIRRVPLCGDSAVGPITETEPLPTRRVTLALVGILACVALVWTSGITGTDQHTRDVAGNVWSAVVGGVGDQTRSVDVLALFSFGRVESGRTIDEYITNVVEPLRAESPDEFYASSTYSSFPQMTVPPTVLATTHFGAWPSFMPLNIGTILNVAGKSIAKLIQVAVLIGFLAVLMRRRWIRQIDTEYYVLASSALLFVLLCVAVPLLSVEYGLFRAFQQSLLLFAPLLIVGLLVVGQGISKLYTSVATRITHSIEHRLHAFRAETAAALLAVVFLVYATGVVSQLIGRNVPPVHLNSRGDEYNHYVTEPEEVEAIQWLVERLEIEKSLTGRQPVVQSDRYGEKKLRAFLLERVDGNIYPGSIRKDSYVFIGPAILERNTATVRYEGALIKYYYPLDFLNEHKSIVYSNDRVRIYR
jgi:uncharacterized membrane protein